MKTQIQLTRDDFRNGVFERDNHLCVICGEPAVDAHHIIERRLFGESAGYFLDNGASLCSKHHLEAEMTTLSCEDVREACGIEEIVLPEHLYSDQRYDKWGNQILKNNTRIKGELFEDGSVQKILKAGNVLGDFVDIVKYPRTYHLPWSPGVTRDDRIMPDYTLFEGQQVMICEKRDGENTTLYNDRTHARSLDTDKHPSRDWMKNFWAQYIAWQNKIPEGWRVCGENMYAKHSIHYTEETALDTYFEMFSIWNDENVCLSWDETEEWSELLDIKLVPVFYKGIWDMDVIEHLNKEIEEFNKDGSKVEGYVVRLSREYHYSEFRKVVGKYVRANHVHNHGKIIHWKNNWIKNDLKNG
jgi:RNA ligase-like protein